MEKCVSRQRAENLSARKLTLSSAKEKLLTIVILVRDIKSVELQSIGFGMLRYTSILASILDQTHLGAGYPKE